MYGMCSMTPQRFVNLQGVTNVRDLGGYIGAGGLKVKWRKVYRSGDLDALTADDLQSLASLGIKTIVDFRSQEEMDEAPDKVPVSVVKTVKLIIDPGSIFELWEANDTDGPVLMQKLNMALVTMAKSQMAAFFSELKDNASLPLLFHCSAGKDRTGFAAALFLSALGVDRETIYEDYMLSAKLAEEKYRGMLEKYPELFSVITVRPEYLKAAFDEIEARFGGMERYLTDELGVDLDLLRAMYLT